MPGSTSTTLTTPLVLTKVIRDDEYMTSNHLRLLTEDYTVAAGGHLEKRCRFEREILVFFFIKSVFAITLLFLSPLAVP